MTKQAKSKIQPPNSLATLLSSSDSQKVSEALQQFKKAYTNGYRLLMQESKESKKKPSKSENSLKMLDSVDSFTEFLFDGKPISELLGYSEQEINKFFDVASRLMNEKRYEEAKEAFFFLITIAPNRSEFWLGLGYAYGQCKEPEGALRSYIRVIELSPHRLEGYLGFAHLFTTLEDYKRAQQVCDIGLKFAAENKAQTWANELIQKLKQTKQQISQLAKA